MRLGGVGRYLCTVQNRQEMAEAVSWALERQLPVVVIGTGSNIVWRDEGFSGLIIVNQIKAYEDFKEDDTNHYLTIGGGENWDSVVAKTVAGGLTGIEALSLIPGTAGATPVQNVGAYGQEIAQTLVSVEAYDRQTQQFVNVPASDCQFGYRQSRFKGADHGRFFITSLTLHLLTGQMQPPFYSVLQHYFDDHGITSFTPEAVRQAVIDIRSHKLPNPATVANCGSFFANPSVNNSRLTQLQSAYPNIPHWPTAQPDIVKLPAAWLLEEAGFKNYSDTATGMATWSSQPLVLVNQAANSTADLLNFKQKIIDTVAAKFNIVLVQEPELLP